MLLCKAHAKGGCEKESPEKEGKGTRKEKTLVGELEGLWALPAVQ